MSDHAISNARAWAGNICEAMAAFKALNSGDAESVTYDGETYDDANELRERIVEEPLSVQVRSGWYSPGAESGKPEEYEILLSTGGPALRIIGDLDEYGQPYGAPQLQWQDWGTPWTTLPTTGAEDDALSAYAGCFYFGD